MKKLLVLLIFVIPISLMGQNLRNLGLKKAAGALQKAIEKEDNSQQSPKENTPNEPSDEKKKTLNKEMSEEEVLMALDNASEAVDNKKYSQARSSIQEVMVEIEGKLGRMVLKEMPEEINGYNYDPDEDAVLSTGMGFIGLDIKREYSLDYDIIRVAIANNSAALTPYTMALSSPQMISQEDNMKIVKVNGKRSVLELDEYENSFSLHTPFGESSVFMLECPVCEDEAEVIRIAELFDLDKYLVILGETPVQFDNTK